MDFKTSEMKNHKIKNKWVALCLSILCITSCSDVADEITSLDFNRLYSPITLEAKLSKIVNLTLSWGEVSNAQSYVVEIYKDSLEFAPANLVLSEEVADVTFAYTLQGDTRYSARVKSISSDKDDSKWNEITFETGINSIFLSQVIGDVGATDITLRWPAGSSATRIVLTAKPAAGQTATNITVTHEVTQDEIDNGMAKVTGLDPSMAYDILMYNNDQRIGKATLTTIAKGTIYIKPEDDFAAVLAAADEGTSFLVLPGEYLTGGEKITIDKNMTISGVDAANMPLIHAQFEISALSSFSLKYLTLNGVKDATTNLDYVLRFTSTSGEYGNILVENCDIKNYTKSLVAGESTMKSSINSITFNNCVVTNILTNSADGIDIRAGYLKSLTLKNSTFNNVSPARDFVRLDDASATFPNQVSTVSIDRCTFYKVANNTNRIVYVRFKTNVISITNSIFANMSGYFTNQSLTSQPECSKNNYYLAPNFLAASVVNATAKYDVSSNYTTLDPAFANPLQGDFTVSNSSVTVGDPRWIE
jgi:hypothetical protein